MMRIGVLALQGAFIEHKKMLERLGAECVELRQKKDLTDIDGIVLPGGESTVQGKLLKQLDMMDELKAKIENGWPLARFFANFGLFSNLLNISNFDF